MRTARSCWKARHSRWARSGHVPDLRRELVGTLDALSSDEAEEVKYLPIGRGPAIVPGLAASLADLT